VHEPAIANGGQYRGKGKVRAKHSSAEFTIRDRYCLPGSKCDVVKNPAIFPQRDFSLCATVEVIENDSGKTATRQATEVVDVDDAGRGYRTWSFSHAILREPIDPNRIIVEELLLKGAGRSARALR